MDPFVGRQREKAILQQALDSQRPELVAIYGRRRVGKTFLVEKFFENQSCFIEIVGAKKAKMSEQLFNFTRVIEKVFLKDSITTPKNWSTAFELLLQEIHHVSVKHSRIVIFFDELPWLATAKSHFLSVLEYYWNRYFSKDPRIIVILCGSASSWMIKRIVHNRGGLYGRLTRIMRLLPFQLREIEEFLQAQQIQFDRKQLTDLSMAVGGIPYYLSMVPRGVSAAMAINDLFFQPNAALFPEFDRVFRSLFDHYESHIKIIRVLASTFSGLTKTELLSKAKLSSGGSSSRIIQELQESGFIAYIPEHDHPKTGGRFVLIDEYCLFYLTWVENAQKIILDTLDKNYWVSMHQSHKWKSWSGYAFEMLCLKHIQQIKQALGISGVKTIESSWYWYPPTNSQENGAQIDLVIDRQDKCMNLIEIKYADGPFVITKEYAKKLENKKQLFREKTGTRKTLFTTLLTPYGVKKGEASSWAIDSEITLDALFG
jgi:AAA+ ATPase superfamily predicted ATPase